MFVVAFSTAQESVPAGRLEDISSRVTRAMVLRASLDAYEGIRLPSSPSLVLPARGADSLIQLRRSIQPDLVLLPSGSDASDHQVLYMEATRLADT